MSETSTTISIGGKEYRIASDDSREQVQRMALYLDEKLSKINQENVGINAYVAMMLTALNVVEDYMTASDTIERLNEEYSRVTDDERFDAVEQERDRFEEENRELRQKVADLQHENDILRAGISSQFARKLG